MHTVPAYDGQSPDWAGRGAKKPCAAINDIGGLDWHGVDYGTFFDNVSGTTYIPFQIAGFYYYQKPDPKRRLWVHAKERFRSEDGQVLHSDVNIMYEDGSVVASVVDLNLKRAGGKALIEQAVENKQRQTMYEVAWKRQPALKDEPLVSEPSSWLVIGSDENTKSISRFLNEKGENVVKVDSARAFACVDKNNYALDVCHSSQWLKLLKDEMWSGAPPLQGVIHMLCLDPLPISDEYDPMADVQVSMRSAFELVQSISDDKKLSDMDWASFEKVMSSKVDGSAHLHNLTKDIRTMEHFVLFSSATSVMGNVGQANYAAANFYLDALAHSRALEGLPALSINWGPWAEVGMAADATLAKALGSIGVEMIPVESGLSALEMAMTTGAPQFPVLRISWAKYLPQFGSAPPSLLAALVEETEKRNAKKSAKKDVGAAAQAVIKKLVVVPSAKRVNVLSGTIQAKVMEILGITDASVVDTTSAISDFGLDSMMSVELRNELQDLVGMELPGTLLFDYPTIQALTTYLLDEVLDIEDESAAGGAGGAAKGPDFGKCSAHSPGVRWSVARLGWT